MPSCRYIFQHGYNLSLVDLVDRIATPHVKKYLSDMTFKPLNTFPSPKDYAEILDSCAHPLSSSHLACVCHLAFVVSILLDKF